MVLDPISALGAAAAILQFLDFSMKLVSKASEIKKSADGVTVEHSHILTAADVIATQCHTLETVARGRKSSPDPLPGEETLAALCEQTLLAAQTLQQALEGLRTTGTRSTFKSFRAAIKSVWDKDRIAGMRSQLEEIRSQLMLSLLIVLR